jgi:hypothetical protein
MTLPRTAPQSAAPDQKLSAILAFIFGTVFLAALLVIAVVIPSPTPNQFETFRIAIALAAGGVAAVIPGLLGLRLGRGRRFAIRASGALAVFLIVYFYSPAHWMTPAVTSTSGYCSPVINGAHDVNLNCQSGN